MPLVQVTEVLLQEVATGASRLEGFYHRDAHNANMVINTDADQIIVADASESPRVSRRLVGLS